MFSGATLLTTAAAFSTLFFASFKSRKLGLQAIETPVKHEPEAQASCPIDEKPRRIDCEIDDPLEVVSADKAVYRFLKWCRSAGETGYFTASEIASLWDACCDDQGIYCLHKSVIWNGLDTLGLKLGQTRIEVDPRFAVLRQRVKTKRPVVYRIPKAAAQARAKPNDLPEPPAHAPAQPTSKPAHEPAWSQSLSTSIATSNPLAGDFSHEIRRFA